MSLLQEIQENVVKSGTDLGPVLLKLRLLASRLGSPILEEWVKHESEGYPSDVTLPDYRIIPVTYSGTFFGAFGSGVQNAPIPSYLIEKYAGEKWTHYELRQSIAAIDDLIGNMSKKGGTLQINASNLILLLQGKIYEDYSCNDVTGTVSRASLVELQHAVKSRVLELTIELEKSIPSALEVTFGKHENSDSTTSKEVTQISQQVIYGNVTSITSSGDNANITIEINQGDKESFKHYLIESGIVENDASDLAEIVSNEDPGDADEPLGLNAKSWLLDNLKKAANGTWKIGTTVATEVIKKAILKYYGFE